MGSKLREKVPAATRKVAAIPMATAMVDAAIAPAPTIPIVPTESMLQPVLDLLGAVRRDLVEVVQGVRREVRGLRAEVRAVGQAVARLDVRLAALQDGAARPTDDKETVACRSDENLPASAAPTSTTVAVASASTFSTKEAERILSTIGLSKRRPR